METGSTRKVGTRAGWNRHGSITRIPTFASGWAGSTYASDQIGKPRLDLYCPEMQNLGPTVRIAGFLLLWALSPDSFAQYSSHQLVAHWPAAPRPMLGSSRVLLSEPGSSGYRIVSASGILRLAKGSWGDSPELAIAESSFTTSAGTRTRAVIAADGSMMMLSNCRLLRYDADFRPVFRTGPLQLTTNQDPGCYALATTAGGTTYVRDSGNGVLVIDAAGVQQDPLPLPLPGGTDLDAYAMVTVGESVVVAGSVGNQRPWIGLANAAGQLLWSHVIDTPDGIGWSTQLASEAGEIYALFATSDPGGARVLLRRYDVDGNELPTGHADTVVSAFPGTRMIVRGGSKVIDTDDGRLLRWQTGESAPSLIEAPGSTYFYSFDVDAAGRLFAIAEQQLLRYEPDGSLGATINTGPTLRPLQLAAIDGNRIVVSAWQDDAGQLGIAQFDGDLALQRVDPMMGVPRVALTHYAESGAQRYLIASDYETEAGRVNSLLIATDAKGRELWRRSGDFSILAADIDGVWTVRDQSAVRFAATGEELGSQDLSAYVQLGQFPRLRAGQAGEAFLDSDVVPGAPGECRVIVVTVAGLDPLISGPCGGQRAVSVDGELTRTFQGALVRTRRDGTQRYSVPLIDGESSFLPQADGSAVLLGMSNWRLISATGEVRWLLPRSTELNEVDGLFLGSDLVYRVSGAEPVMVSKHRLADGALLGQTQLGHVGPDLLNIGAGRVDAEGRLLLVGQHRVDNDNWVLTTHVVEPDLSLRVPQIWARGASNVGGVWSENGAVYAAIGSPLDDRQTRPAIIRAAGEIWVDGFED